MRLDDDETVTLGFAVGLLITGLYHFLKLLENF